MEFPKWNEFTPENVEAKLATLLATSEEAISELEKSSPKGYEDFVWVLDDKTRELWRTWGGVSHMLGVMNSDAWRKVEESWQPKIVAFSLRVSQSKPLYEIAKALLNGGEIVDPIRLRILKRMVQGAELAGVGLEGDQRARFNEIQMQLAKLGADFHNAVIDATKAFKYEKDGKAYTIDDANYPQTMKHCADREVRERLCCARAARAPENEARIAEILKLRQEEAKILGFDDYVAVSLSTKCAPSVSAVTKMIDELDKATEEIANREAEEIGGAKLEPWDQAFEAERLRERKYAYSEDELKRYFELEDVVRGLFRISSFLFNIEIREVTGEAKPQVWHADVRFFEVLEGGKAIAHFYFDPFVRSGQKGGGAWMNEFRNRRQKIDTPLSVIVTNFPERDDDGKCYLPFREVETLFHEFGHALQCMLTRIEEEDAAGINLIEWDAVEVASQFMENWCLDDRTGIIVPPELKAKVRAAKNFRAATACRRQLAFAKTDIDLHSASFDGERGANAVKIENFVHFGMPMVEEDRFLCSFSHIFSGGYAAGYYGYKWAEVMSADCFSVFEEAGLGDDEAMKRIGAKYRETILGLGGSKSALQVFREFRGRDPEIEGLLRQQGLKM